METDLHFSSERDDWATPQKLVNHMSEHYRLLMNMEIKIDLCATAANTKCDSYISLDDGDDSLAMPWHQIIEMHTRLREGELDDPGLPFSQTMGWMNPPYGRQIGEWIWKAYDTGRLGQPVLCLLPARTDTKWWHEFVLKAYHIWFIKGRLHFDGHDNAAPFPSAMALFLGDLEDPVYKTIDAKLFRPRKPIEFGLRKLRIRNGPSNRRSQEQAAT